MKRVKFKGEANKLAVVALREMKRLALVAALSLLVALLAMPGVTHAAGSQQITRTFVPATNAAVAGEGDGNGFEITPANAYDDDADYAVDNNSGVAANSVATGTGTDKHNYYNFGMDTIPSTSGTINGITVRADIAVDDMANAPFTAIRLSWDGGTSWTAAQSQTLSQIAELTYTYGGAADTWGRTWSASDLTSANFMVQVINGDTKDANSIRDFSLDYIQVTITFTPAWDSYSDTGRSSQVDTFSDSTNVVYMKGTSFWDNSDTQTYIVSYYDGGGLKIATDSGIALINVVSDRGDLGNTTGVPSYEPTYNFTDNPTADPGTWHMVVQPTGAPQSFPSDYSSLAAAPDTYYLIADDTSTVEQSAIPEFSTVMAAIGVAGMCFGVYWWMRKKYRMKMGRVYVPS
ncbi:MAG: hypothetical protein JSU76_03395 [Dehalococcoidia bacterium]|nr:MAG: hypothetical protein JSU76_03395 [Dehalococcoidia bacterium]